MTDPTLPPETHEEHEGRMTVFRQLWETFGIADRDERLKKAREIIELAYAPLDESSGSASKH